MSTTEKMFVPNDGMSTTIRFLGKGEKHVNPISIGGPCNRSNTIKIPATKETEAFFAKEMAKAQHNSRVMGPASYQLLHPAINYMAKRSLNEI